MLPKGIRLKKGVFDVMKHGKRLSSPLFLIYFAPNKSGKNRYAVVAGKKIGKATFRNKIRRRVFNSISEINDQLLPGFDIIIVPSKFVKEWNTVPFETIKGTIFDLLKNI